MTPKRPGLVRMLLICVLLGAGVLGILGAHPDWVQRLIIEALGQLAG